MNAWARPSEIPAATQRSQNTEKISFSGMPARPACVSHADTSAKKRSFMPGLYNRNGPFDVRKSPGPAREFDRARPNNPKELSGRQGLRARTRFSANRNLGSSECCSKTRRHGRTCHRKSGLPDLRQYLMRKSGKPDFRCHPRLCPVQQEDVDARDIGVRKHAVLRTAMRGHDGLDGRALLFARNEALRSVFSLFVLAPAFSSFSIQSSSVPLFSDALPSQGLSSPALSSRIRSKTPRPATSALE